MDLSQIESPGGILKTCVEGPIGDLEAMWPNFMQQALDPKLVAKRRTVGSRKPLENINHVFVFGLRYSLEVGGWKVTVDARTGGGYVDLRLLDKRKRQAVVIELKSSDKEGDMEGDANKALERIIDPEGLPLPNINTLREYGIGVCHLISFVKGRYLEPNDQNHWVEKDDPAMSVS